MKMDRVSDILNGALRRLQTKNRSASVRSLAVRVRRSPSYLSKIFRGEKPLPLKLIPSLEKVLQLDHHEISELQGLVLASLEKRQASYATGVSSVREQAADANLGEYLALGQEDYWLLEEWYLIPVLNLATTADFVNSPSWIATRLGISSAQARDAVYRLIEAGHLREENGRLFRSKLAIRFPTQRSHPSLRQYHRMMTERAAQELEKVPTEADFAGRLISGISFAGDPRKIAEAKLILEEAAYRAAHLLAGGSCTEVFQLNLQLFRLTLRKK